MTRLRNYFLAGLLVAGPAGISLYLVWSLITWLDSWVKPYLPLRYNPDTYLPFAVPGFGAVVGVALVTLIGFLSANIAGRTLWGYGEHLLHSMPVVRNLYKALKQIFVSVLAEKGNSFQKAALLEFPREGVWTIGFVTSEPKAEVGERLPAGDFVTVYVPTTPNPTGGYLLFVPRARIIMLDMSVEDAAKLVISFGLVSADSGDAAKAMIEGAGRRDTQGDGEP